MKRCLSAVFAGALTLAAVGSATAAPTLSNAHAFHVLKTQSKWLKIDAKHHSVVIKVVAAYNSTNGGYNFDGYASGDANFSVPYGWKVQIKFSNNSADSNHSLGLASDHGDNPTIPKVGGKQVQIPQMTDGIANDGTVVKLTFTAKPAKKFFLVCEVPGHDTSGMWDSFTISKSVKTASMLVR